MKLPAFCLCGGCEPARVCFEPRCGSLIMMGKLHYTLEVPTSLGRRVKSAARREKKRPGQIAAEAIEWYLAAQSLPGDAPTQSELRSIRRGRAAYNRGEFVSLDEFRRKKVVVRRSHRSRAKIAQSN